MPQKPLKPGKASEKKKPANRHSKVPQMKKGMPQMAIDAWLVICVHAHQHTAVMLA